MLLRVYNIACLQVEVLYHLERRCIFDDYKYWLIIWLTDVNIQNK